MHKVDKIELWTVLRVCSLLYHKLLWKGHESLLKFSIGSIILTLGWRTISRWTRVPPRTHHHHCCEFCGRVTVRRWRGESLSKENGWTTLEAIRALSGSLFVNETIKWTSSKLKLIVITLFNCCLFIRGKIQMLLTNNSNNYISDDKKGERKFI
jgi:hypothetical protein